MEREREIRSISELYNFAAVETLRHQFSAPGVGRGETQKPKNRIGGGVGRRNAKEFQPEMSTSKSHVLF